MRKGLHKGAVVKVSIEMRGEVVLVRVPPIGSGNAGDLLHFVRPGQDFWGMEYDRLLELGAGEHEFEMPWDSNGNDSSS